MREKSKAQLEDNSNCCQICPMGICSPYRRRQIRRMKLAALGIKLPPVDKAQA